METKRLRIALNMLGGAQWTGGLTYRNNLVRALQSFGSEVELLLIGESSPDAAGCTVIPEPRRHGLLGSALDRASRRVLRLDYSLSKAIAPFDIDVVFPEGLHVGRKTASVYWIPDFQFVHLPQLYTAGQIKQYNVKLRKYFDCAARIVVSSEDAGNDLKQFASKFASKVRVLPFVAHVPAGLYDDDPRQVADRYHIPADFVFLPNQFWAHKNHERVFQALAILRNRGVRPSIVCSGNPVDVRSPLHFAQLLTRIAEMGVRDQVSFLGLVPHRDVYSLIRQSKCVLNPSLFEGWSTSVEEAKSVGKRVLLSHLPVHREQAPPGGMYFDPHDPDELAAKLSEVWTNVPPGPDSELERAARAGLPTRMRAFGQAFLAICREAVQTVQ